MKDAPIYEDIVYYQLIIGILCKTKNIMPYSPNIHHLRCLKVARLFVKDRRLCLKKARIPRSATPEFCLQPSMLFIRGDRESQNE
jgi:hypothetical protein